jgi:hypothetical protein
MSASGSGLGRLAIGRDGDGQPFLAPHHLLAAQRLETLIGRARLAQRVTMSYDPARVGRSASSGQGELADSAADARRRLNHLAGVIPTDCWNVLFDVCGLGRGLQDIETARRWPRRSAKLVLRIGLSQLAQHWGLDATAVGTSRGIDRAWLSERLPIIPERSDD